MDIQEDLTQQDEQRNQAQQAQGALTKKLGEDHQQKIEQIQHQQDLMNDIQRNQQESINQAAQQALELQARQRELGQQPVELDGKNVLDAQRERMEKAAEQCHALAQETQQVAEKLQENLEQQQKIAGVLEDESKSTIHQVATERQTKTVEEGAELQAQHEKLTRDFNIQVRIFEACQSGFQQEHEQQSRQLNEAQERLQADQQRQAQEQLDAQNKQSSEQLSKVAEDLEKRHAEALGAKWKNQDHPEGLKPEEQKPNGQQFEEQLKKTGELNGRLVEIEQLHGLHNPHHEPEQKAQSADEQNGAQRLDNTHALSDQLTEEARLRRESVGDRDGRSVQTPSAVDAQVNKVQDTWSQHEQQQQKLIKDIRAHEKNAADFGQQLKDSIAEHGDMSAVIPKEGDDVKKITDIKKQQEDLAKKVNQEHERGERKAGEFKRNETDFQRQSWDRVGNIAKLTGDKNLQQKAELKSQELKQKIGIMDQRLDQKYGPKHEEAKPEEKKAYSIKSEGEVNNGIKPVSPAGIPDEMVKKASEQKQAVEDRGEARRLEQEQHKISHKR